MLSPAEALLDQLHTHTLIIKQTGTHTRKHTDKVEHFVMHKSIFRVYKPSMLLNSIAPYDTKE